jgi:replicative DNA helicase
MKPDALSDRELEQALLASLLSDNSGFDRLGHLEPDDLTHAVHAAALSAMLDLKEEGRAVTLVTLRSRFATVPFGDDGSVLEHLKRLEFAGKPADVGDMAAALRELSQRREIKALGERIAGSVHDQAAGPARLLTDAARSVDDLLAKCRPAGKTLWSMPEAIEDLLSASEDKDLCVPIGLADFDRTTSGGLRRGELAVIGGRPSMGKSALALVIARRVARAGHGVLVFSLEMQRRDCLRRMATDACWSKELSVSYQAARAGKLNDRERRAYEHGARTLADLPLLIEESSGLLLADIASGTRRTAERLERDGKRLSLVIIDHIGFLTPTSRYKGNRVHEVSEITAGLQRLAKAEHVVVLALHQLNREVEGRDNKRPTLSDLRDSGSVEQDADIILFPYRAAYYLERMKFDDREQEQERLGKLERLRTVLELNIAKQRNGPSQTIELFCDMAANAVRDHWRGN